MDVMVSKTDRHSSRALSRVNRNLHLVSVDNEKVKAWLKVFGSESSKLHRSSNSSGDMIKPMTVSGKFVNISQEYYRHHLNAFKNIRPSTVTSMDLERETISIGALKALIGSEISTQHFSTYQKVFRHKSASESESASNERLEWIGDSVLSLVVSRWLYEEYPEANEGALTRWRTKLVCSKTLARLSGILKLWKYIEMDEKGVTNQFYLSSKVLEDTLEALIGAIYLCEGFVPARKFVLRIYSHIDHSKLFATESNYKDVLMRLTQRVSTHLPVYTLIHQEHLIQGQGELSRKRTLFTMSASITLPCGDTISGFSIGFTKKDAEQSAAQNVILQV